MKSSTNILCLTPHHSRGDILNNLIICVIVVNVSVLIWFATQFFPRHEDDQKTPATRGSLAALQHALQAFNADYGRYPTTAETLNALVSPPARPTALTSSYIKRLPLDGWGNPFLYTNPSPTTFTLSSPGPDGIPNTQDDLQLPHD